MSTPNWPRKRPAPRQAPGTSRHITDDVHWTRIVNPRERYRIVYVDRDGVRTERTIELTKIGESQGIGYIGVIHDGIPKTMRQERIVDVLEQFTTGHAPSIFPALTFDMQLPRFPIPAATYRIATTAVSNRTWQVNLETYTCTCPEGRIRSARGYKPGQLGFVCDHMAKAILTNLPADRAEWSDQLLAFLANPRNVHIDNLV